MAINEGDAPIPVTRGTEIGHFKFGGSTHIMAFEKDKAVLAEWAVNAVKHQNDPNPAPMGSNYCDAESCSELNYPDFFIDSHSLLKST
jgi:hypothetical protein